MKQIYLIVTISIISSAQIAYSCRCVASSDDGEVCGSDGISYANDCALNCATMQKLCLRKVKDGKCGQCMCTMEYNPTCGSDCKTYGNPCALSCQQEADLDLFKLYSGPCRKDCVAKKPLSCACSDECAPVCGSNGRTYDNDCKLRCAQYNNSCLEKVRDGTCGECVCTKEYNPVCGTDGKTYGNPCMFNCGGELNRKLQLANTGPCPE